MYHTLAKFVLYVITEKNWASLPDFQVILNTTNSRRNMRLVGRRHVTNEDSLCSKITSKYQTCLILRLDEFQKKSGSIIHYDLLRDRCTEFQPLYYEF